MSTPPSLAPAPSTPVTGDAAAVNAAAAVVDAAISDRHRIVELVATGGMGAVVKAERRLRREWLAVKLLLPAAKGSPELTARLKCEARAATHIQHPNITSVAVFGTLPNGSWFLVLEYVRGTTLDRIIEKGPVPAARAAATARQIAAAHERARHPARPQPAQHHDRAGHRRRAAHRFRLREGAPSTTASRRENRRGFRLADGWAQHSGCM